MNLNEANQLAEKLLSDNNLNDYKFKFDYAKKRFGYCSWDNKIISLSEPLVSLNTIDRVRQTILHEIAHALTPYHNHDRVWKYTALKLGDDGERCYSTDNTNTPEATHIYECSKCGFQFKRLRRLKNYGTRFHSKCGKIAGRLKKVK